MLSTLLHFKYVKPNLKNVEPYRPSKVKLEIYHGPVSVPHLDDLCAVLPFDHPVLGQLQGVVHAEGGVAPLVLNLVKQYFEVKRKNDGSNFLFSFKLFTPDLVTSEAKAPDLQGAGLGVQGELPQVHLAAGRDSEPLGVGDPAGYSIIIPDIVIPGSRRSARPARCG